jgi:DNA polymerase III sliding clamp (beta) subunit (PCNA family)
MNRSELVTTLELVAPALADNNQVPMFENYCFTGKTVLGYNDRLSIVAPCKTTEAFAVNGKVLLGLLKNSHSDDVDFVLDDKHDIAVKAGKSRFNLPFMPAEDSLFEAPTGKVSLEIPVDDTLLPGLEACLLTSSKDLTQEALLGVTLKPHDKTMAFYSCDGDAVTRFLLKAKATDLEALLPNEFCEAFVRIASESVKEPEAGPTRLKIIGDEWAWVHTNTGIDIYGRLLKPDNPLDHEELIAKTIKGKITFKPVPKALDHALSRARIVADPESAKTELEVSDGKLLLYTSTHMGDVHDNMTWREHPEAKAAISAMLVQRAIGLCDEMAVLERCTAYRKGQSLFIVASNMG